LSIGRLVCSVRNCEAYPIKACSVKFFCQEHADLHLRDETKKLFRSQKKAHAAHPPRLCPGVGDDYQHFTESLNDAMVIRQKVGATAVSVRWAKESENSDRVQASEEGGREGTAGDVSRGEEQEGETGTSDEHVRERRHEEVENAEERGEVNGIQPLATPSETADNHLQEVLIFPPPHPKVLPTPSSVPLYPVPPAEIQAPPAPPFPQLAQPQYVSQPPPFVSVHFVISEDGFETIPCLRQDISKSYCRFLEASYSEETQQILRNQPTRIGDAEKIVRMLCECRWRNDDDFTQLSADIEQDRFESH
jgi:hypothetical protein